MKPKKLIYQMTSCLTCTTIFTGLSLSCSINNTIVFYNYKAYLSPEIANEIYSDLDYKVFDTINEFTNAIKLNKVNAGIGSDQQAVQLIRQNYLQPINYLDIFWPENVVKPSWAINKTIDEILNDHESLKQYRNYQKNLLTKEVFDHLESYDKYLIAENNKDNQPNKHLIDYMVPYFNQDAVIAYNPSKIDKKNQPLTSDLYDFDNKIINDALRFNKQNSNNNSLEMIDILQSLKHNNFKYWAITDAVRDLMIYGSSYYKIVDSPKQNSYKVESHPTGEASTTYQPTLYKTLLNNFAQLIEDGTGEKINSKNIYLSGVGLELVNKLIDPNSNVQVALIYNGDAIDAFDSLDNDIRVQKGTIRYLRPSGNIMLVDGLIIPLKTDENTYKQVISAAKKYFFGGLQNQNIPYNILNLSNKNNIDLNEYSYYENAKKVGYTSAYKNAYYYMINSNFKVYDSKNQLIENESIYYQNLYKITNESTIFNFKNNTSLIKYNVKHTEAAPINMQKTNEIYTEWNLMISS
ncbi:hypothetical protein [Mycoplasmopsis opalescens]|uniref:hypothetical protein n=1 Tax=Mycoplasmopsis opalescens TaxID=114886 RepID=UPI0004A77E12|nr:hypothetical protein [Mycoplasmopsis opalescens]